MPRVKYSLPKLSTFEVFLLQCRRQICTENNFDSRCKLEHIQDGSWQRNNSKAAITDVITLNDKVKIPCLGFGVYDIDLSSTQKAVLKALECGYRQIDTAARYKNEKSVGQAIKESCLNRNEIFVTTKVYHDNHGYEETRKAFEKSLRLLDLDFVDLYLIHFPVPGKVVETWTAMVELQEKGLIRSIGVSNFNIHHLEALKVHSGITPSVNQIEVHPFLQETPLVDYCRNRGIAIQAYSPLTRGQKLNHAILTTLSKQYMKSPAQILLRWSLQKGFVCIPKSCHFERIKENAEIFDFHIGPSDMEVLNSLEEGFRTGRDKILWPWNG